MFAVIVNGKVTGSGYTEIDSLVDSKNWLSGISLMTLNDMIVDESRIEVPKTENEYLSLQSVTDSVVIVECSADVHDHIQSFGATEMDGHFKMDDCTVLQCI